MPKRRTWGAIAALLVLVLLLTACGGGRGSQSTSQAPQSTSSSTATTSSTVREIRVTLSDFKFEPAEITVKRGERVRLVLQNTGTVAHDWTARELNLASPRVQPGQTATYEFTVDRAGTFTTVCVEAGHEALGMTGRLIVEN
ncbi:MAG TPA: cupredoxin domain-containing protein [Limnochordales bacterium]